MSGHIGPMCARTMLIVLATWVIILADHGTSGAWCRFASTSSSQGTCIFPCRCTKGCNTTTGECTNGGRCEDGHPSGNRWGGTACQTGNIGYNKQAHQSGETWNSWSRTHSARRALNGNTDPDINHNSCAHPSAHGGTDAWWMVDLGRKHRISRVVIYNRKGYYAAHRLDTFTLSVGNSRDSLTQCAKHNIRVAASGSVEVACLATGRYLQFKRNGGYDRNFAGLCEVVIIGYLYIDCMQGHCNSTCDDAIGCEACIGSRQPDCKNECEHGTYGVNCQDVCGQCKDNATCNVVNGLCSNGCENWYTSDVCNTLIPIPHFGASQVPHLVVINSSAALVSWPKANNISSGLESYYYYEVLLHADGETERKVANVSQSADEYQLESHITGLLFNTYYSVTVKPYRQHYDAYDEGTSTNVTRFKTTCIAPDKPIIENATKFSSARTAQASMVVKWKVINDSGCDAIVTLVVWIKSRASHNESWLYNEADTVKQTQMTIDVLSYELYDVSLTIVNNENLTSTSESFTADLTTPPPTAATTPQRSFTSGPDATVSSGGLSTGGKAGLAVAVVIVIASLGIFVGVLLIRRKIAEQSNKAGSGKENANFDDGNESEAEEDEVDQRGPAEFSTAIYANTQQVQNGVALGDLAAYVKDKRRDNGFEKEFGAIPFGIQAKCTAAEKPDNKSRNRFLNIIAYDHTRVVLAAANGQSDYVNASHIMGYNDKDNVYIACQGPRDWNIEDMYNMIWQEKSNTIVMLANVYEMGKEKCSQYWPEKGNKKTWGIFITESISEEKFADYVIREFSLKNEALKKMRRIRQLHFTGWPDKGTPGFAYPLLVFHRKVHSFDSQRRGPLVVHCSAGVGRTGTFIAIDILIDQVKAEGHVDVFRCVNLLRTQRMNMVQTLAQYIYVYQALIEMNEVAVIQCSQLKQMFDEMCRNNKVAGEFERLNALSRVGKKTQCAALEPKNVEKNRFNEIIPDDDVRPYLLTPWKEGTNYINAVYVTGYKERNAFIVTQSPMTVTVVDLWRLVNDHEARTVVMLDDSDGSDDECAVYWPIMKCTKRKYGPFDVELVDTVDTVSTENANVTVREFTVNKSGQLPESGKVIKQFQLNTSWSRDPPLPGDTSALLNLLDAVEKWQQLSGNGPIVIHCTDGASRCGLVCAASYLLEHMKVEQEVDVFHAVQHVRTTRPQLITHLAQYRFLYELALAYMSQFDTYANFQ